VSAGPSTSDVGTGAARSPTTAARPAAAIAQLRAVTKVYGSGAAATHALRGIDLDIAEGEFVAVMGPSGSGKSTCMNILGCLDTPTRGSFRFRGTEVTTLSQRERALLRRHSLGFIFQGYNLLPRTSAIENVELPLMYRGSPLHEREVLARRALAGVGLSGWESHTPSELSGGQQQRVAIARAMVTEPALLLADEPTGNLDSERSQEVMDLLDRFNRERGVTIVMVTHEPDMARYARRTIRFVDGRVESDSASSAGRDGRVAFDSAGGGARDGPIESDSARNPDHVA
jgi:putative ABC transport system ATP-binding protein